MPHTHHHPDPAHPLNLPNARKMLMLVTLSLAAWVANYTAAAHLTAFPQSAKDLKATIPAMANTIGIMILGLGTGPLLWNAFAASIGRRPTLLFSWLLFFASTFWLSFSKSFDSFAAARYFAGFFASSSQTIPATMISETFTPENRGAAIAFWALLLIIGPVSAPIVCAAFLTTTTWRWTYYFTIILAGVVGLMLVAFVPETLYNPSKASGSADSAIDTGSSSNGHLGDEKKEYQVNETHDVTNDSSTSPHGHIGAAWYPWREPGRFLLEILQPLLMARYIVILVPSIVYAVVFMWSVGLTVVAPQVLERPPWGFTPVEVGAGFLAAAVGSIIGKFAGGWGSDRTVTYLSRRNGSSAAQHAEAHAEGLTIPARKPEYRIWATLPHWPILLVGLLLFGLGFENHLSWPAEIIGGFGVFYISNSALGGMIQTYIVESHLPKSVHGIALFNFIKCCLAFAAPFFIPKWSIEGSFKTAYVTQAVVTVAVGYAVAFGLILFGERVRRWQRMPGF